MQAKNLGPGQQVAIGGCGRQTPPPPVSSPVPVRNLALLLEHAACSPGVALAVQKVQPGPIRRGSEVVEVEAGQGPG